MLQNATSCEWMPESQRERMGIEPTSPSFEGDTGFEVRGGHQSRVRSRGGILEQEAVAANCLLKKAWSAILSCSKCDELRHVEKVPHVIQQAVKRRLSLQTHASFEYPFLPPTWRLEPSMSD